MNNSLKVGFVGAGGISNAHLPGWQAMHADVGVYSLEGAQVLAERANGTTFASLDELLDWCDVVDVVTPTPAHHDVAIQALERGRPVVCEKPMARTSGQARAMLAAAEKTGTLLFPAHVVRFFPAYAKAWQTVRDGKLGGLAVQRFRRDSAVPNWSGWFTDEEQSGGVAMDLMIHDLDIARWFAGPVTQVYGHLAQRNGQQVASAVLTHADGTLSHVRAIWGSSSMRFGTAFAIFGQEGTLRHSSWDDQRTKTNGVPHGVGHSPSLPEIDPYHAELRDFVSALQQGTTPRVTALDGLRAVELAEAFWASVHAEHPVDFDEGEGAL